MSLKCTYNIPTLPLTFDVETKEILKQLSKSRGALAELKGFARIIPNEEILINTGLVEKVKVGKTNYYFNTKLIDLFLNHNATEKANVESIESVLEI